jgi:NitT/TauT family transport system permease protein
VGSGRASLRRLLPVAVVILVLLLWELVVRMTDVPQFILPAPSVIITVGYSMRSTLLSHGLATVGEALLGFFVGSVFGIALALLLNAATILRSALYPLILATQTTPKIAIAPLFVIWFGVGLLPKVLIVALLAFFPVLVNTTAGLEATDQSQRDLFSSVAATRWQVYRHLKLPAAVPYLFAGLQLGLTVSMIGAIIGEWMGSDRGFGFLLLLYNSQLRTAELFVVIVILVIATSLLFGLIVWCERRFSWEHHSRQGVRVLRGASEM